MFFYLLILFTVLPALELAILINIGTRIGAATTIMIIIMTGIWGAYLARLQGFIIMKKIQANLDRGQMPSAELLDGLMVLVGGIVLLTPGFITDVLGLFLLIPLTRSIIKKLLQKKFEDMIQKGHIISAQDSRDSFKRYDDIDIN